MKLFQPISTSALCKTHQREGINPIWVPLGLPASCWGQSHCRAWPAQGMSRSWDAEHTAVLIGHGWDICSGDAALGLLFVTTWTVFQRRPSWVGLAGLAGLPAPRILPWGLQLTTLIRDNFPSSALPSSLCSSVLCICLPPAPEDLLGLDKPFLERSGHGSRRKGASSDRTWKPLNGWRGALNQQRDLESRNLDNCFQQFSYLT